jgi:hypothetical protein
MVVRRVSTATSKTSNATSSPTAARPTADVYARQDGEVRTAQILYVDRWRWATSARLGTGRLATATRAGKASTVTSATATMLALR